MMNTQPIPPRFLIGGNAETLYAKALQRTAPNYRRELIRDSFGEDDVAYDFVDVADEQAPCVVLLHGLEGSSRSHYAVELMYAVQQIGWHGVVAHFLSFWQNGMPKYMLLACLWVEMCWQNIWVSKVIWLYLAQQRLFLHRLI